MLDLDRRVVRQPFASIKMLPITMRCRLLKMRVPRIYTNISPAKVHGSKHQRTSTFGPQPDWCWCISGGPASLFIAYALCASVPSATMTTAFRHVYPKPTDAPKPPCQATVALYQSTPCAFAFAAPDHRRFRTHCVSRCPRIHAEVDLVSSSRRSVRSSSRTTRCTSNLE